MASHITLAAEPALARLDWECAHFGLSAAQLVPAELSDDALAAALRQARLQGVQLLVWPAADEREVSPELLAGFGGALVDRKATYRRVLDEARADEEPAELSGLRVEPYTQSNASPALVELAIAAGAYSRFRVDARISRQKFEAMYRLWIERSVTGQLADCVLVVNLMDEAGHVADQPVGLITVSESGAKATIGLVAVAASVRGRGMASALMRAAHRWMHARGAHEARVVTQLANVAACRLYERSGYRLARVQPYFHFWL